MGFGVSGYPSQWGEGSGMTATEFDRLLEQRIDRMRAVLASKAVEYASNEERLYNFKSAEGLDDRHPAQVCWGYLLKHLLSVRRLSDATASGSSVPLEVIDEKIGDAVNYLVLLEAILKEGRV